MKFEIRYSRKIRDAVAVFTIFMFICQYGLTREDVAENFSRTAPTWGWFALDKPDWEFWNEKLKETRVWNEEDFHIYKREVFKKGVMQSVYFLPVFIYCSSYAYKWASRIKDLTKEYQRAALRQLIDEKQKVYIKTESIEG